jgi:shikimate dehydrogenase
MFFFMGTESREQGVVFPVYGRPAHASCTRRRQTVAALPAQRRIAMIDAHTSIFVIFGDPIAHIRAPVVWNSLFQKFQINASYIAAHVAGNDFDAALVGFKGMQNLGGFNFTMPHKQAAVKHADRLTERASLVGSINLMRRETDGTWTGDNVDGAGFIAGLRADGIAVRALNAYVLGTGGVGRTIAIALASEGVGSLAMYDLIEPKAEAVAEHLLIQFGLLARVGPPDFGKIDLIINATPVGLEESDPLPFGVDELRSTAVVVDVIMEPVNTRLLKAPRHED